MNIFASSSCPIESAKRLDDIRCCKMVLESTQMLSTVMHIYEDAAAPYKITHANHPCTVWVAEAGEHFTWVLHHLEALCNEYTARYGKVHKCQDHLDTFRDYAARHGFSYDQPKYFVNCTTYKDHQDVHVAYMSYLNDKWDTDKRTPTWYKQSHRG